MFNLSRTSLFAPVFSKMAIGAILSLGSLFIVGCETTESVPVQTAAPMSVEKGMTEAEVIAILGEPKSVEEIVEDSVVAHVWRYEKDIVVSSTIESDGEQERVYADPETGQFVTVREPIYRNEVVKGKIIAEILFADGKVVAMKERKESGEFGVNHGQQ